MAAPVLALVGVAAGVLTTGTVVLAGSVGLLTLGPDDAPPSAAAAAIPPAMLTLYQQAAPTCPGLSWAVLAAIGTVESSNGTSDLPGVHSGANSAGAEGPMQFEPATFAAYDMPVPPGGAAPPNPYDPTDAVYAAARDLCANGAGNAATLDQAVFAYNHSSAYVSQVLALAQSYVQPATGGSSSGAAGATAVGTGAGAAAVQWAMGQIGTPYIWGGETPGVGFDCSGLVQAAYEEAGISLPRVAQDQYDAGPPLPPGSPPEPGDLVFFGGGPDDVEHVGLVVSPGVMVDAPFTGAFVREDQFPSTPGAAWGSDIYVGATRPGVGT
jgi:cell wall-associated NlpC family hydrolase